MTNISKSFNEIRYKLVDFLGFTELQTESSDALDYAVRIVLNLGSTKRGKFRR